MSQYFLVLLLKSMELQNYNSGTIANGSDTQGINLGHFTW